MYSPQLAIKIGVHYLFDYPSFASDVLQNVATEMATEVCG